MMPPFKPDAARKASAHAVAPDLRPAPTVREQDTLDVARARQSAYPDGVHVADIARVLAISTGRTHKYACRLMLKGWLVWVGGELVTMRVAARIA